MIRSNTRDFWERHAARSSPEFESSQRVFVDPLRMAARGRTILDCGAGIGTLSGHLAGSARRVVGIDFSEAMVRRARALFPDVPFHLADVLEADLGERFDIICGIGFLHEIPLEDTPALLAFLKQHLAPGGFCWFQENSFFNPVARFMRRHIVGRYGVPKYGSEQETPFDPPRWRRYQQAFRYATRSAEAFVGWQRVWTYLIRRGSDTPWRAFDRVCSRLPDPIKRQTSYIQHIYLSQDVPKERAFAP